MLYSLLFYFYFVTVNPKMPHERTESIHKNFAEHNSFVELNLCYYKFFNCLELISFLYLIKRLEPFENQIIHS